MRAIKLKGRVRAWAQAQSRCTTGQGRGSLIDFLHSAGKCVCACVCESKKTQMVTSCEYKQEKRNRSDCPCEGRRQGHAGESATRDHGLIGTTRMLPTCAGSFAPVPAQNARLTGTQYLHSSPSYGRGGEPSGGWSDWAVRGGRSGALAWRGRQCATPGMSTAESPMACQWEGTT